MSKGQEVATVKSLLRREDYQSRFKEILGQRAAQFSASVVNISRDKNIAECDPASVIAAAIVAATLDLPVDKNLGFAWIVPYKQVASFQMGYKGYVQLALRSGQYARMNAKPVNKEAFDGYDDVGEPRILWDKVDERQPAVGYAFAWKLVGGFSKTCYWPKERVEAHAKQYSQSYRGGYQSPWKTHFDQMALKTVIKNELSDWGILSIGMQLAMKHDQGAQVDIESEVVYVDNGQEQQVKTADLGPGAPASAPVTEAGKTAKAKEAKPAAEKEPATQAAETARGSFDTETQPAKAAQQQQQDTAADAKAATQTIASATPAADADFAQALEAVRTLLKNSEITEDVFMAYAVTNKFAKKNQKLDQLATAKLVQIASVFERILPEIRKFNTPAQDQP